MFFELPTQKPRLLLVTNGFPFGESERGFLPAEFQHLSQVFQVSILAASDAPLLYPFPEDTKLYRYMLSLRKFQCLLLPLHLFRPSVFRELWRAAKGCSFQCFCARARSILGWSCRAEIFENRLRKMMEPEPFDLIYTYWCTEATLASVRLKKKHPSLKVITRFHGYDLYRERSPDNWQPFREEISRGCDRLIFAADAGHRYYLETWGRQLTDKCAVCFLGSREMTVVQRSDGRLTLVSCSNLIPLKRVGLIIDALALMPETLPVEWHHFGDGQEREGLSVRAEQTLLPHIHWKFWGHIPNFQLDGLYQTLKPSLFITTTSTEGGIPVSVQEAFSAGIPTIATAVDSIPEIVRDGETGILLSENHSPAEVAATIQRFYALSAAEKSAMGAAARALWEERFNAEKNAEGFIELLEDILSS